MRENTLLIAAAGSGKTTHLVNEARRVKETPVLVTTYTEANEVEIRKKFRSIPANITVQTWFSFLLEHGVRPYQSFILSEKIKGMALVNSPSGVKGRNGKYPIYYGEDDAPFQHYLTPDAQIYSDKISKFVCTCNKRSNGAVLKRLAQIYSHIFIDEVQDLAGYDLELIRLMMKEGINIFLVGDPRQVTYLTHHPRKYPNYKDGKIKEFITNELPKRISCTIDETTLSVSHRNNQVICELASKLYPSFVASIPCNCTDCTASRNVSHSGIYIVDPGQIEQYLDKIKATQLRWDRRTTTSPKTNTYNFGYSKGLGFDHVLIYPTEDMLKWIFDINVELSAEARAKFYVAITRARHSVAVVSDAVPQGFKSYIP